MLLNCPLTDGEFRFRFNHANVGLVQVVPMDPDWTRYSTIIDVPSAGIYEVGVTNTLTDAYFINYDAFAVSNVPEPAMAGHGIVTAEAMLTAGLAGGLVIPAPEAVVVATKGGSISAEASALVHALASKAVTAKVAVSAAAGVVLLTAGVAGFSFVGSGRQTAPAAPAPAAAVANAPAPLKPLRTFSHPDTAVMAAGGSYTGPPKIEWTNCEVRVWDARTGSRPGRMRGIPRASTPWVSARTAAGWSRPAGSGSAYGT